MPDSDEEYDRRNRTDRFVRERDYGYSADHRPRMGREFNNMDRSRRDYSNGVGMKRPPYGPRRDEPYEAKRGRFDDALDTFEPEFAQKEEGASPVMLTFKKFLATQDDSLNKEEAVVKYKDYKLEFKRQECERYFQAHKEEEWFRLKYHPTESTLSKEEQQGAVKRRLELFNELLEKGLIDGVSVEYEDAEAIIRLMDSVVLKLEGGSDEDVDALKLEPVEDESIQDLRKAAATSSENASASEHAANSNSDSNTTKPLGDVAKTKVENGDSKRDGEEGEAGEEAKSASARRNAQLHKTCSIFFRSIPPSAKVAELETLCKQRPGFLRLCLTDPMPDKKFLRHAWATFRRSVNVNEIFWGLKNAKLVGENLGAAVNADLKRRVRSVNGATVHKAVAQNDIRQASKLVVLHDHKAKLYVGEESPSDEPIEDLEVAIVGSKNPVLQGIIDYLVEEANAEEEQLLGVGRCTTPDGGTAEKDIKFPLEVDKALLRALDKIILYLRIVHSIDYYNYSLYANEDQMPNRLGMIHVRGQPPKGEIYGKTDAGIPLISKNFIGEFISVFNTRLSATVLKNDLLTDEELAKLGKKDPEKAVEEFVDTNCVKLADEKWLCPLSQKKFKAPEFVHKHLQSKYGEKIEEVRSEAEFFNNFIADPERPVNVESKKTASVANPPGSALQPSSSISDERPRVAAAADFGGSGHRPGWQSDRGGGGFGGGFGGGGGGFGGQRFGGMTRGFGQGGGFGGGGRDFAPRGGRYFGGAMGDDTRRAPPPMNPDRQQTSYRDLDAVDDVF